MRIISIANHKGGVGKTTTVASLGKALSLRGKRVLLVDLDAQMNLTESLMEAAPERSIYEALIEQEELPVVTISEGLDLVPGSLALVTMDMDLALMKDRERKLSKLLKGLDYDFILLDCPPSLGLLTVNALTASTEVFIPLTAEAIPARGVSTFLDVIEKTKEELNPSLELSGIIITRYQRRKINRLVEKSLRGSFGDIVFKTLIRENVDVSEAPLSSMDIFSYSPKSLGAQDYADLAEEVLNMKY